MSVTVDVNTERGTHSILVESPLCRRRHHSLERLSISCVWRLGLLRAASPMAGESNSGEAETAADVTSVSRIQCWCGRGSFLLLQLPFCFSL